MGVKPVRVCCGVRGLLCCGAPPRGLCKASHDTGICWKQFMMRLETTCFGPDVRKKNYGNDLTPGDMKRGSVSSEISGNSDSDEVAGSVGL